jgi:hypothetical protein
VPLIFELSQLQDQIVENYIESLDQIKTLAFGNKIFLRYFQPQLYREYPMVNMIFGAYINLG